MSNVKNSSKFILFIGRALNTFGSKTIARHEIDKLLESSKADSNRRGKYCKLLESGFYLINI